MAAVSDLSYRWNPYYVNWQLDSEDVEKYHRSIDDVLGLVNQKKEDIFRAEMDRYHTQVYDKLLNQLAGKDGKYFDQAAEIMSGDIFDHIDDRIALEKGVANPWSLGNVTDFQSLFADISTFGIRYKKTVENFEEFEQQLNSVVARYGELNKIEISEKMKRDVIVSLLANRNMKTTTTSGERAKGDIMTAILNRSSEDAFREVSLQYNLNIDIVKMIALVDDLQDPPDFSSTYFVRHSDKGKSDEYVSGENDVREALADKFEGWMRHLNNVLHEAVNIQGMVKVHGEEFQQKLEEVGFTLKSDYKSFKGHMDITTQVDTKQIDNFLNVMKNFNSEANKIFYKSNVRKTDYGITITRDGASSVLGVTAKASNLQVDAGRDTIHVKLHEASNALRFLLLQAGFPLKYMPQLNRILASRQGKGVPSLDDAFNNFKEWVKYNSLVNAIVGLHNNPDFNKNENIVYMVINQTLFSVWDILNEIYDNLANENVNTLKIDVRFQPNLVRKDFIAMNRHINWQDKSREGKIKYMNERSDALEGKITAKLMGTKVFVNLRFQDLKALARLVKLRG